MNNTRSAIIRSLMLTLVLFVYRTHKTMNVKQSVSIRYLLIDFFRVH